MIGKTISHYKILEKLGEGGMGVVYKAEDTKLKRTVALKFLSQQAVGNEEDEKRFVREAQAAAALHHANICTVYEIDQAEGQTFIAMAYLDGQSLKEKTEAKPLKLDEALDLAMQLAQGLQEAHENGIVHRDIKSSNVMVTTRGQAVLMDFGLARQAGRSVVTQEGATLGTISYMSPEQAQGATVDHRTDIWSFGVMLYEMVSGQLPFKGDYEQAVVYSIMNEEPEPLTGLRTGVPMELERIVNKALSKNSDERYQNTNDMLIDLRAVAKELEAGTSKTSGAPVAREKEETGLSFFKDLIRRRVPQILGIYCAAVWGIIKSIDWLVSHYPISPHLSDFGLITLASIIPTVFLLAYFHGKPGGAHWTRVEKVGIPVNLLAAAALLFFMFQNKDLGAATNKVALPDSQGKTIEQLVPKSEFRKSLAVYFFENESGDSTWNWLQYGIMLLVDFDLDQDPYIFNRHGFYPAFKEAGFEDGVGAPLALKKKIAANNYHSYFVAGSFTKQNDTFTIKSMLYETKRARLIAAHTFAGNDLFLLADSLSVQIKRDLKIPAYYIEAAEDLPVGEMFTKSLAALKLYRAGQYAIWRDRNYAKAASFYEKAIQEDQTFAFAQYQLHQTYVNLNRRDLAEEAIRAAMQYSYKLPKMYQFWIRNAFYKTQGDWQSAAENARLFVTLYPQDPQGSYEMAYHYGRMNRPDLAIVEYKRILELDPGSHFNLRTIGDLFKEKGEYEQALKYYEYYARMYPQESRSFTEIGDLYKSIGEHEQSKAYYKKALLIEPESATILSELAGIELSLGNFGEAEQEYQSALQLAKRPRDRSAVHQALSTYHKFRGHIARAIEHYELYIAELEKYASPLNILLAKSDVFGTIELYILAGKQDKAWKVAQDFEAQAQQLVPPWNSAAPYLYVWYYTWLEDPANADVLEEGVEKIEAFIKETDMGFGQPYMRFARGIIHEFRNEYSMAIAEYEIALSEMEPPNYYKCVARTFIGKWYRKLNDLKKAEEALREALVIEPFFPNAHCELALVYHEMDKGEKALEHLETSLKVWQDADPEYEPARMARERLAEWQTVTDKM